MPITLTRNNDFRGFNITKEASHSSIGELSYVPSDTIINIFSYISSPELALNQRISKFWREHGLIMILQRDEELTESHKTFCRALSIDPAKDSAVVIKNPSLQTHAYSLNAISGKVLKILLHYRISEQENMIELAEALPIPPLLQPIMPRLFFYLRILKEIGNNPNDVKTFYIDLFREQRYEEALAVAVSYFITPAEQSRLNGLMLCCASTLYSDIPERSLQIIQSIPEDLEGTVLQKNYVLGNFIMDYFSKGKNKEGIALIQNLSGSLHQSLYFLDLVFLKLDHIELESAKALSRKISHPLIKKWAKESITDLHIKLDGIIKDFIHRGYLNLYGNENRKLRYPKRTLVKPNFDHADSEIMRLKGDEEALIAPHFCANSNCILNFEEDRALHLYALRSEIAGNHALTLQAALKVKNIYRQNIILMKLFLRAKTRHDYNSHLFLYRTSTPLLQKISKAITDIHFSIGGVLFSLGNCSYSEARMSNLGLVEEEVQRLA